MTGQATDILIWDGAELSIFAINDDRTYMFRNDVIPGIPDPESYGIDLKLLSMASTGNRRGYIRYFALTNDHLYLEELHLPCNFPESPVIDGVLPELDEITGNPSYKKMNRLMDFTGQFRVGLDSRKMGDLTFKEGILVESKFC